MVSTFLIFECVASGFSKRKAGFPYPATGVKRHFLPLETVGVITREPDQNLDGVTF